MMEKIETENSFSKEEISIEQDSSSFEIIEETSSENEEVYFGNELISDSSEETKVVWVDSESEEENLRREVEKDAEWLNDKKFLIDKKLDSKFTLKYKLGFFKTNYNIKLIKCFLDIVIIVDTMNIIYILENLKLIETIKIEKFRVSDVEFFNGYFYVCSERSNRIKEINLKNIGKSKNEIEQLNIEIENNIKKTKSNNSEINFDIKNINKEMTRNIRKLKKIDDYLYVLGDTFLCLDERLNIVNEIFDKIIDIRKFNEFIYVLNKNGNIIQFDKYLNIINKIAYEEKFIFKGLETIDEYLVVITTQGLIFIDDKMQYVKETLDKSDIVYVTEYENMILYLIKNRNGLKVMDKKFNYINIRNRLPMSFHAVKFNNDLLICSHREVHQIQINK